MKPLPYLPSLTSLRGIAALLVVIFHVEGIWIHFGPKESGFFLHQCYLMVDFFFLLSGFIMVHVYGSVFDDAVTWSGYKRFIQHRFARIYPLHVFTLAVLYVFYLIEFSGQKLEGIMAYIYDPWAIPTNLLLLHSMGLHPLFNWNVPSWSISTEWWVYMIFPLIYRLWRPINNLKFVLVFIGLVAGYLVINYVLYPMSAAVSPTHQNRGFSLDVTYDYGFFRCLMGFVLGMQLHRLYISGWMKNVLKSDVLYGTMVLTVFLLMHFGLPDYLIIFCFAIILLMATHNTGLTDRLLRWKPLQFLGNISYSVYLVHGPLIFIGLAVLDHLFPGITYEESPLQSFLFIAGYMVLLLGISFLTCTWIEVPMRRWLAGTKVVR